MLIVTEINGNFGQVTLFRIWIVMEDGKIHSGQVEIEFNKAGGVQLPQVETLMQDLFGLTQELVGIMLQYVLVLKHRVAVVTTD
jgi:hypothetical protein